MRKLMFMCMLMLGISIQAQDFDFSCVTRTAVADDARLLADSLVLQFSVPSIGYGLCATTSDGEVVNTAWLKTWASNNPSDLSIEFVNDLIAYIEDSDITLECD